MQHAHGLEKHTKGSPSDGFLAKAAPEMLQNWPGATANCTDCTHSHTCFTHLTSPGDCMFAHSCEQSLTVMARMLVYSLHSRVAWSWELHKVLSNSLFQHPATASLRGDRMERNEQCPAFLLTPPSNLLQFAEWFVSHQQHTVFSKNSRKEMVQTIPLQMKYCPGPTFHLGPGGRDLSPSPSCLGLRQKRV